MNVMRVRLLPFSTPNYVIAASEPVMRQDGFKEAPKWPLSELDAETLAAMCDDFRAAIFKKAGKPDPQTEIR